METDKKYGLLDAKGIVDLFYSSEEIRLDFGGTKPGYYENAFHGFINWIIANYPDSPIHNNDQMKYLLIMANEAELTTRIESTIADTCEHSLPLSWGKWAGIFGISTATLRKAREAETYHFRQISVRRWTLPINELPAEYLEKYRRQIPKTQP